MGELVENYGQLSFFLRNEGVCLWVTENSGRMTAQFQVGEQRVNPYYLAPWWNEKFCWEDAADASMRGCWFAFPFGLNKPWNGKDYPVHGYVMHSKFEKYAEEQEGLWKRLFLKTQLAEDGGVLEKCYGIRDGDPCIYMSDKVVGVTGRYPVGYHPTLRIPTQPGHAILDMSRPLESWTSPTHIEDYTKGGYSCLLPDYHIIDITKVPTVYGKMVDLTKQPFIKGFDDIWQHMCDPARPFTFSSISVPEEGYLYFQLKNPRNLTGQMIWSSYGGRYYAPWLGRVNGCIGLEEVTAYFHYGITSAYEENPLSKKGYRTYESFDGGAKEYRIIQGTVKIPADFKGVKDIVKYDEERICIKGRGGEKIQVSCSVGFLEELENINNKC